VRRSISIAADIGGTFTDVVVLSRDTGGVVFAKSPTTPHEPAQGVLNALAKSGASLSDAAFFFHGTTLGLNALLERSGVSVGLLTTRGFRDALELRRFNWPMYKLHWTPPEPLVARRFRREIPERVLADGRVSIALDEDAVRREARFLADRGVESIAVCYINGYAHPAHELRTAELIEEELPDMPVTLSHEVSSEPREYERTSTTVADAFIKPVIHRYLEELEASLRERGFEGALVVTRCDGGVMGASEAKRLPIRTVLSGPASGVLGASALSLTVERPNVIAIDMGGTSFDASLVVGSEPRLAARAEISDLPLLVPVVDLATIGAGGGSLASVDAGGAFNVGPQSAGAVPGPACYGKGGTRPTVTDAALVSGLLDPANFLGGDMPLDVEAARTAIADHVAGPLDISIADAAAGIIELTETKMAATLQQLTIESGHDPRDFSLVAFGGGGSLVASGLANRLDIREVVVPVSPGTFSAWGMLTLDIVHDFASAALLPLDTVKLSDIEARFSALDARAHAALEREGIAMDQRILMRSLALRYAGQEHVLSIKMGPSVADDFAELGAKFNQRHLETFGYSLGDGIEVTDHRVRAVGSLAKADVAGYDADGSSPHEAHVGSRSATHIASGGTLTWGVYQRLRLRRGNRISGPAIIEEAAATTLIGPNQRAVVDEFGNLRIVRMGSTASEAHQW
jgi:N-methylhydantoinase A